MRVAALYDVHGNLPAFEAVLDEVAREAPDLIVVGGDVALGPLPIETLERLLALEHPVRCVRGNTDREIVELYDGAPPPGDGLWERRNAWTAHLLEERHRDTLASFAETVVVEVDGLGGTLFCHGSPRRDDEPITRVTPDGRLADLLAGVDEKLVVCGHTHVQFDRTHAVARVVNAGSVGMPAEGRRGAYWLMLGPEVELRRTEYDVEAAARRFRTTAFPEIEEFVERVVAEDPTRAERTSAAFEASAG
jgi:predicted phosphodiesterase